MSCIATEARGFAALIAVLMISSILLFLATTASEGAFSLRASVLHTERLASARAAAESCTAQALLVLAQTLPEPRVETGMRTLDPEHTCRIDAFETIEGGYALFTSAPILGAWVRMRTEIYVTGTAISRVISREI